MGLSSTVARLLAAVATAVRRRRGSRFTRDQWRRALRDTEQCGAQLLAFGRTTDQDFTALAKHLGELNRRLTTLRSEADAFQRVLEDQDEERAIASAYTLYKNSIDLVHASIGIAISEQEQMCQIESSLIKACKTRENFQRNHLLLRILTMSIRMEASRLDSDSQGVFLNVAGAIADIDHKIAASSEAAFARIDTVIAETRAERDELKNLEQNLHTRAQTSIQRIQDKLTMLKEKLAPNITQSHSLTSVLAELVPQTLQLVGALQFQDIVRQQLEHVAAGFNDLRDHLRETAGLTHTGKTRRKVEFGYVHHAARVQQAHLETSRSEFQKAADTVVDGLRHLLDRSTTVVEQFASLEAAGTAAFNDFDVAAVFKEEIQKLAHIADRSKEANDKLSRLVQRIDEVVRLFSREVGQYEMDVKIVALNAQIAAARMPSADALNKLAEETSTISGNNADVTRELTGSLQCGLQQLHGVKQQADEFLEIVTEEKAALESGVATVARKLASLTERVRSGSSKVRASFEVAHHESQALFSSLAFPAMIESSFGPSASLCARLLGATHRHARPEDLSTAAAARLDAHRDRYTMHKENATHSAAVRQPAQPAPSGVEFFGSDSPPGAGDVEMFGSSTVPTPSSASSAPAPAPLPTPPPAPDAGGSIELF